MHKENLGPVDDELEAPGCSACAHKQIEMRSTSHAVKAKALVYAARLHRT